MCMDHVVLSRGTDVAGYRMEHSCETLEKALLVFLILFIYFYIFIQIYIIS